MKLTQAQLNSYAKNGYLVVENLVAPQELQTLRERIDEIQEGRASAQSKNFVTNFEPGEGGTAVAAKPILRKLSSLAPNDAFFRSIATKAAILDCVAQLTGNAARILLYSDQAFLKPAFHGTEKPLHQDNSYFKVEPMDGGVTCWMAIDDATVENGCMNYIPGSHKLGLVPHKAIKDTPHLTPEGTFGAEVPVPIPAGACIFHHLLSLHSSKANNSPKSRRAWALHYVNAAAKCPARDYAEMIPAR
ncbi:MAG: phytanoyl-CoA dioxygenase family protein [Planctomycetes bacterium]|nr:phytanoyl-CoA dioxygenase family protein [Planctomycetota bacterium]